MKKHLSLVFIFALIGCASISFEPVTHPDQRIQLGKFSFLPPSGKNWEANIYPLEYRLHWETWGRSTLKVKLFNKNIVGPNHASGETEKLKMSVFIYKFALRKFDKDDDLLDLPQDGYFVLLKKNSQWIGSFVNDDNFIKIQRLHYSWWKYPVKKGIIVPESRYTLEKINKMNCATYKGKTEGAPEVPGFKSSEVIPYIQKYICVHPRYPSHILKLRFDYAVLKGYTPTDIQKEIDSFFASLQVH